MSAGETAVSVEGLSFHFPGRSEPALDGVSFTLPAGSCCLVAGPTGSGKSTLARALCGWIPRESTGQMQGAVLLFGRDTRTATTAELASLVGLVMQSSDDQLCTSTVAAEVAFGLQNLGLPVAEIDRRIDAALAHMDLAERRDWSPERLSGGQKQRLLLAAILAMQPRLLVLDEPLAQLDAPAREELFDVLGRLRRDGMTIVLIEHRLDEVWSLADSVLVLDAGKVVAHAPREDQTSLSAAFQRCRFDPPPGDGVPVPRRRTLPSDKELITVKSLTFQFRGAAVPLWEDVSFTVRQGDCIALVGPNGGGKSTLFDVLAGVARPTSGFVLASNPERKRTCGLVLQNPDLMLYSWSVRAELALGPKLAGIDAADIEARVLDVACSLGLEALLDDPPQGLSQGQRLRTAVGAMLTAAPPLLLLDEPTTGQDPENIQAIFTALEAAIGRGEPAAVIFSTHDLPLAARYANRMLILADGKLLADGPPETVLADETRLRATGLLPTRTAGAAP